MVTDARRPHRGAQEGRRARGSHGPLTFADAEEALARRFHELEIRPAQLVDVGFGSLVLETSGGAVFRVARDDETSAGHELELRLLPAFDGRLPVRVPQPRWRVPPGEDLPHGAIGYAKLPGRRLSKDDDVAAELAAFLHALHEVPVREAERLGVPRAPSWPERMRAATDVLPLVADQLRADEGRTLGRWAVRVATDPAMIAYEPVFVHGDAWYGNVLVDGDPPRLVAVVDWEGARIGDPADDLAPQFYLGDGFAGSVLAAYGADEQLLHRVRCLRELREFTGLAWAVRNDDAEELAESLAKLRKTTIFGRAS